MPYSTQKLPGEPIVVQRLEPGPGAIAEIPDVMAQGVEVLDTCEQPVYLVINLEGLTLGFDDIIQAASKATRGTDAVLHHPNIIESLFVVTNRLLKMGLMGMSSDAFGKARIRTFDTLEQAMEYCRQRIAEMEG